MRFSKCCAYVVNGAISAVYSTVNGLKSIPSSVLSTAVTVLVFQSFGSAS